MTRTIKGEIDAIAVAKALMLGEFSLDGIVDGGIHYIGKARRQPDGSWHVLADVGGALCLVAVRLRFDVDALINA